MLVKIKFLVEFSLNSYAMQNSKDKMHVLTFNNMLLGATYFT